MAGILDTYDPLKIYTKENWSDAWVEREQVEPLSNSLPLGSSTFGKFEFRYRYGNVKRSGAAETISLVPQLDIAKHWVQVRIKGSTGTDYENADANIFFQGRIAHETIDVHGKPTGGDPASGEQAFTAYDGLYVLYKVMISDAKFDLSHDPTTPVFEWRNKLPPINMLDSSGKLISNMSRHPDGLTFAYEGNRQAENSTPWDNREYLDYLLARFDNANDPEFAITGSAVGALLSIQRHYPLPNVIRASDIIKMLINKRDGLDFAMVPTTNVGSRAGWNIEVFSVNESDVTTTIHSGQTKTLSASALSVDIDITGEPRAQVTIEKSYEEEYNEVRTEGDLAVCCATLEDTASVNDLTNGWTSAEETSYPTDDLARQQEAFSDVFCRFIFDPNQPSNSLDIKVVDSDSSIDLAANEKNLDLVNIETLDWIPVDEGDPSQSSGSSGIAKQSDKRPIKVVMQEEVSGSQFLEDIARGQGIRVQALKNRLGFKASPMAPHQLKAGYGYDGSSATYSSYPTLYSPDQIFFTAGFKHDVRPRIVTVTDGAKPISDGVYVSQIDSTKLWVHRNARLDVHATNLNTMAAAKNEVIRDDTAKMLLEHCGRRARYSQFRGRALIKFDGLALWHRDTIGYLINAINDGTGLNSIKAIVSDITWTFTAMGVKTVLKAGYGQ